MTKTVLSEWPLVRGDYKIGNPKSRISVVTLASSIESYNQASMWGTCKTENLGIEKIVLNAISNSNVRYILICGIESRGHLSGKTLLAFHKHGIDLTGRIKKSDGAIPFIENLPHNAIERFQKQITLINRIGLTDIKEIQQIVDEYKNKGDAYDEEPLIIGVKEKKKNLSELSISGDIIISNEYMIDSKIGIICEISDA